MKLKLELFRYGTLVFGRVLEQAEELREAGEIAKEGAFEVKSFAAPELFFAKLYIRGNNASSDNNIFYFPYDSQEKAEEVCNNIVKLVKQINDTDADLGGIVRVM